MAGSIKVVVDASVVLNWLLPDEKKSAETNRIFSEFNRKKIRLVAPTVLFYEVMNALKSTGLSHRLKTAEITEGMEVFMALKIKMMTQEKRGKAILATALRLNLTGYDAAYVQLAKDLQVKLLTLDQGLRRKLDKNLLYDYH